MTVKRKDKAAAILSIKDADKMPAKGRRQIAKWLRRQADMFVTDGKHYAAKFTARYLYR